MSFNLINNRISWYNPLAFFMILSLYKETFGVQLGSYNIDPNSITLSGISSGGAMAVQYHVAFSGEHSGVGIIAGVPYACAATGNGITCIDDPEQSLNVTRIVAYMEELSTSQKIDNITNIRNENVYIFQSPVDHRVVAGNGRVLIELYSRLGAVIKTELTIEAAHGYPTNSYGAPCEIYSPPTQFINNCSYFAAFEALNHLYNGTLQLPTAQESFSTLQDLNNLIEFDQTEFGGGLQNTTGMDDLGFAYVPSKCRDKSQVCRLHVAFHGCQQFRGWIGDSFANNAGYLEVAEINGIVLIFPQAVNSTVNPFGCWDWWGYVDEEYLTKLGGQMQTVNKMVKRVAFEGTDTGAVNRIDLNWKYCILAIAFVVIQCAVGNY